MPALVASRPAQSPSRGDLQPALYVALDSVATAFVAKRMKLLINADQRQPFPLRPAMIGAQKGIELILPGPDLGLGLPFPLIGEGRCVRPQDLADGVL